MNLRPPTPDELAITSLVEQRERHEATILYLQIKAEHLSWFLDTALGFGWERSYQQWRNINAKELKEHVDAVKKDGYLI